MGFREDSDRELSYPVMHGAPQISFVPLSSKIKNNPVHVQIEPGDVKGYRLKNRSDFMPEDILTLAKGCIRGKSGYIPKDSTVEA